MINSNHDDLCDPPIDPKTPRVEAVINEAMERFPGVGNAAQARYYEAVHQELAPLARELERTRAEQSERIGGLIEQHGRDSAELRRLCAARDEAKERVRALTAKCALLAASLAQEEARSAELEKDAARYRFIRSRMEVGAVKTQLPLYRTLHWIGYEDCTDTANADEAVDAEIEREGKEQKEK